MATKTPQKPHSREEAGDKRASDDQTQPLTNEECLDEGLRDSMDASDPPAATQPGDNGDPVPSSGYNKERDEKGGKEK